ncbi:MAG: PQQ-dependent sugar dehydrogenase [Saprospiraceae bacterium]
MKFLFIKCIVLIGLLYSNNLYSQNEIKLTKIVSGFAKPLFVTHAGDDRLFIVEQAGKIKIVNGTTTVSTPFLNITDRVNARANEQGLLGLAFHPQFKTNGYIFVNYISNGANRTIISRFNLLPGNPNEIDSLSEKIILVINQPFTNHNGGCMNFGKDGFLYIGQGDGGSANDPMGNGQNRMVLLAKMLRIDVNTTDPYKVPSTNPFFKDSSYLPEIWAMGLRNPWRWSFDRLTGDMWIGDVGQNIWEEVDFQKANSKGGENYGWRCYEGHADFNTSGCNAKNTYIFPIVDYMHSSNPNCGGSITGGYVYRGSECSYLYGNYIYADYCTGNIWAIVKNSNDSFVNRKVYTFATYQISSFGEDVKGELYMCALSEGAIYRISDTCSFNITINSIHSSCDSATDGSISLISNLPNCNLNYIWNNGNKTNNLINLNPGTYTVTISYSSCSTSRTIKIKSQSQDTACITPVFFSEICDGDSALIVACDTRNSTYQWYLNGILVPNLNDRRIFVKQSGSYQVQTINMQSCESVLSKSVNIIVHPRPMAAIIKNKGDSIFATSGYISYIWYLNGQLNSSSTSNYLIVKSKGYYQVEVIDSNGCRSFKSDTLFVIPTGVTNANIQKFQITPNPTKGLFKLDLGTGFNEELKIKLLNINGAILLEKSIHSGIQEMIFNLSDYPNGAYWVQIILQKSNKVVFKEAIIKN